MEQISKKILRYSDENYRHAINARDLYNFPITVNYGAKHERVKYIIGAGTSDNIELWQDGIFIYVLTQNNGLSYIALEVINTELKEVEDRVFLNEEDTTHPQSFSAGILDKDSETQIKILFNYLNY